MHLHYILNVNEVERMKREGNLKHKYHSEVIYCIFILCIDYDICHISVSQFQKLKYLCLYPQREYEKKATLYSKQIQMTIKARF